MAEDAESPYEWAQIEILNCTEPNPGYGQNIDEKVYLARTFDCDGRAAEALCLTEKVHPLQRLRTALHRGQYDRSLALIEELDKKDNQNGAEVLLEKARLYAYSNSWTEALHSCNQALYLHPGGITHQTLLQVRAVALFELGEFDRCLKDIDTIATLSRLYPASSTQLYAQIIRFKIMCVQGDEKKVLRIFLDELWRMTLQSKLKNLDSFLSLTRAEIANACFTGSDPVPYALASMKIAEKTGEDLFRAISLWELSRFSTLQKELETQKLRDFENYNRIKKLDAEITGANPASSSVKIIQSYQAKAGPQISSKNVEWIFEKRQNVLAHLPSGSLIDTSKHKQAGQIISLLEKGLLTKEEFFKNLWKKRRYVPHLHENLVFKAISRVRGDLGMNIQVENGFIWANDTLVLGEER